MDETAIATALQAAPPCPGCGSQSAAGFRRCALCYRHRYLVTLGLCRPLVLEHARALLASGNPVHRGDGFVIALHLHAAHGDVFSSDPTPGHD